MEIDLEAVADTEDWDAQIEDRGGRERGVLLVNALGPAREDDRRRLRGLDLVEGPVIRPDLGVHSQLSHFPGDELGQLRPEIQNNDLLHGEILALWERPYNTRSTARHL